MNFARHLSDRLEFVIFYFSTRRAPNTRPSKLFSLIEVNPNVI